MKLFQKTTRAALWGFAGVGVLSTGLLIGGLIVDVGQFDNTEGGYEPPYTGWTGVPTDWTVVDTTPTGMARRGYVANLLVDCTSGMISVEIYGVTIPFRPFSERALVVHRPREACLAKGFKPEDTVGELSI